MDAENERKEERRKKKKERKKESKKEKRQKKKGRNEENSLNTVNHVIPLGIYRYRSKRNGGNSTSRVTKAHETTAEGRLGAFDQKYTLHSSANKWSPLCVILLRSVT